MPAGKGKGADESGENLVSDAHVPAHFLKTLKALKRLELLYSTLDRVLQCNQSNHDGVSSGTPWVLSDSCGYTVHG